MSPPPALPPFVARAYPFPTVRVPVRGGEMSALDTGGAGRPVLLVHGNPTWSFLWRKVVHALEGSGLRCVAPDLLGLGLSSRPDPVWHSLKNHGHALLDLVTALDLRDVVLVGQDWGGPVGLWMAAHAPERIRGLVLANTAVLVPRAFRTTAFHRFARRPLLSDLAFRGINLPVRFMHKVQGDPASISGDVARAYAWPLRSWGERGTPLALARMVPGSPDHPTVDALAPGDAWLRGFTGPVELVWGMKDPILGRALRGLREALPRARVTEAPDAGHFLQEEVPELLADAIRRVAGAQGAASSL